ncbi:hypothetical protein [Mycolicibacter virginiensis]|uniref:Uncharacterized protein n=1 Tax=Mycolicibacter virginiensis TaxID=1795032 RepID=A0A9X7IMQ7_9MYCO|nr:hypothetical protein [Mycolicibacter virginiensis]PQM52035.1 hypothetical protein C5U48_11770 [Mycolicibacter virginiensis]ULP47335.1 hypothetical protein MJO54_21715 [Mycolicibacter virginiensis]
MTNQPAHRCDPDTTNGGGGPITQARALRILIAMAKASTGENVDPRNVAQEQTGSCPECAARLFFGLAGFALGTLASTYGPNLLMALELQLAGVEADIEGEHDT